MPREVAVAAAAAALVIVVLGALGIWHAANPAGVVDLVDLDGEKTVPAYVSGLLLLAAAGAAALLGRRLVPLACLALAGLFALMGLDEMLSWHEYLEWRLGVDWQLLYAPLALVGGLGWLVVVRRLRALAVPVAPLVAGAVAWGLSQLLENLQWSGADQKVSAYVPMMVTEELLEMTGSALFGLGLLGALLLTSRRRSAERDAVAPAAP